MLNQSIIDQIVGRLRDGLNPQKIILFGSGLSDHWTDEKDIDLIVVADSDLSSTARCAQAYKLLGDIPIAFDVVVKTPTEFENRKNVLNHIVYFANKYGRIIYEQ